MDTQHIEIRQLVERFMQGETTLAEERQLYRYFSGPEIAPDLMRLQPMFADYEAALTPPMSLPARPKILSRWHYVAAAAAALLIIAGGSWAYRAHELRMARLTYEGSYVIVDGQRIDDIRRIRPQIEEALMAAEHYEESLDSR